MSAPAQKPRPAPVKTITRTVDLRGLFHGLADFLLHEPGPGVQLVRPIERDGGYMTRNFV